jgi:prophage regulatory protein
MDATTPRLLRVRDVCELTGLSRSGLYRLVAEGRFPRQRRISHKIARWSAAEVAAWISAQLEAA